MPVAILRPKFLFLVNRTGMTFGPRVTQFPLPLAPQAMVLYAFRSRPENIAGMELIGPPRIMFGTLLTMALSTALPRLSIAVLSKLSSPAVPRQGEFLPMNRLKQLTKHGLEKLMDLLCLGAVSTLVTTRLTRLPPSELTRFEKSRPMVMGLLLRVP